MAYNYTNHDEYNHHNGVYNFARAMLFLSAAVLFIDYFSNKLLNAETDYLPLWCKTLAALVLLFLGAACNYMPKLMFLLACIIFSAAFGIWALAISLTITLLVKNNINVASISILLIFLLKIILNFYFVKKWWGALKIVDKLNNLKNNLN
jgi:hypothetical protein